MDNTTLALIGRVLIGAAFLVSGVRIAIGLRMLSLLLTSKRVPQPMFVAGCGAAIEIVLGILVIAGIWLTPVALLLALFVVAATIMVHDFWNQKGVARLQDENVVISNVIIVGGLLVLAAVGS